MPTVPALSSCERTVEGSYIRRRTSVVALHVKRTLPKQSIYSITSHPNRNIQPTILIEVLCTWHQCSGRSTIQTCSSSCAVSITHLALATRPRKHCVIPGARGESLRCAFGIETHPCRQCATRAHAVVRYIHVMVHHPHRYFSINNTLTCHHPHRYFSINNTFRQ